MSSSPTSYRANELDDLGQARADADTAAIGDKDYALRNAIETHVRRPKPAKGHEATIFAWNSLQYTTEDRNLQEEAKGDLHGGQLHRANRAAREQGEQGRAPEGFERGGRMFRGGKTREGRDRGKGASGRRVEEDLYENFAAGRKPDFDALPVGKAVPEEVRAEDVWGEEILEEGP
jgi:hypothetical protein